MFFLFNIQWDFYIFKNTYCVFTLHSTWPVKIDLKLKTSVLVWGVLNTVFLVCQPLGMFAPFQAVGRRWLFPDFWMKTSNLTWVKHELASDILLPCAVQWVQGGWESIWELWYQRGSRMGRCHTHTHAHTRAQTHTLTTSNKFCLHHWVKQIMKSVNVGGCLASCQSNNGNWVTVLAVVCVCECVLRLPPQADRVSKTNSASSASLSFRTQALVPRVHRRGLSTIECTWALRIKTSSNRKYAKEVIEPFFLLAFILCALLLMFLRSAKWTPHPAGPSRSSRKKPILTHLFFYLIFFLTSYFILQSAMKLLYGFMKL